MMLKEPRGCILWRQPDAMRQPLKERFELLETFVDESHHWRYLLRCRECGHLYFYEFYEEIDWEGGNDPQFVTLVPVETDAEIAALKATTPFGLLAFAPRLQQDWPRDAKSSTVRWITQARGD
jgi:hypothetical protein